METNKKVLFLPLANTDQLDCDTQGDRNSFKSKSICFGLGFVYGVVVLVTVLCALRLGIRSRVDHLHDFISSHGLNISITHNLTTTTTQSQYSAALTLTSGQNGTRDDSDTTQHQPEIANRTLLPPTSLVVARQVPLQCVCRRDIVNVSWVENILVWNQPAQRLCNFHHYSPAETKELFANEHLLVLGDSVSRELAINMAGILLDQDFVTKIVDQDAPHNHIDINPLEFIGHDVHNTTFHLDFFWGHAFPAILLKAQAIPHNVTTAIISFGAWFKVSNLNPYNSALRHDLVSLVWTLCSNPGNTTFVIRLPTLSIYDDDNQNIDFIRSLMLDLIFPNNITTLCCGNHSIVMHDTYTIMDKRSHGELRLPPTDGGIYHFAPIMRVNLMQSVFNIIPHLTARGELDPCCVPVTDRFKAPVENGTLEEIVQDLQPDCIKSSLLTSVQTLRCAVERSHVIEFNPGLTSHRIYYFFFPLPTPTPPLASVSVATTGSAAHGGDVDELENEELGSVNHDSVWVLAKATDPVADSFTWYVNEVLVRYEPDLVEWRWLELPKHSNRPDWTWWTNERWCGDEFPEGCRLLKMVPRLFASQIAAVSIGSTYPSYQDSVDILRQILYLNSTANVSYTGV